MNEKTRHAILCSDDKEKREIIDFLFEQEFTHGGQNKEKFKTSWPDYGDYYYTYVFVDLKSKNFSMRARSQGNKGCTKEELYKHFGANEIGGDDNLKFILTNFGQAAISN